MDKSFATREWLDWLTRVRLLTITLILTIGVVWPQYIPGFSTNRFSNCGNLFSAPCGDDGAGLCGEDSAHLLQPADDGEPSHLARHESSGVSCGGLSGQPPGPVSSQEGRGARREARGTSQPSGFHRRHHSLDARWFDHHGPRWSHSSAESYRRGNPRTSLC